LQVPRQRLLSSSPFFYRGAPLATPGAQPVRQVPYAAVATPKAYSVDVRAGVRRSICHMCLCLSCFDASHVAPVPRSRTVPAGVVRPRASVTVIGSPQCHCQCAFALGRVHEGAAAANCTHGVACSRLAPPASPLAMPLLLLPLCRCVAA
jgi:hypothetical protein